MMTLELLFRILLASEIFHRLNRLGLMIDLKSKGESQDKLLGSFYNVLCSGPVHVNKGITTCS